MLLLRVGLDVALGVGVGESRLLIGVYRARIPEGKLPQTVGGTIAQHINDAARANVVASGTNVTTIGHTRIERQFQVVGELGKQLDVQIGAPHTRAHDDALVVALGQGGVKLHFVGTATDSHIGRVVERRLPHHLVLPVVGRGPAVDISKVGGVAEIATEGLCPTRTGAVGSRTVVLIAHKLRSVHQVELLREMSHGGATVETHGDFALFGRLGGDHHHAVAALGPVDGREGSVFEHVDGGDVGGRNVIDIAHLETVDDVERFVALGHRRVAAYADIDIGPRRTVDRGHLHAGNLALQGFGGRGHRHSSQLGTAHGAHRTGEVFAGATGVTQHHHFVQLPLFVFHDHLPGGIRNRDFL